MKDKLFVLLVLLFQNTMASENYLELSVGSDKLRTEKISIFRDAKVNFNSSEKNNEESISQEIGLRLYPNSLSQIKLNKALYKNQKMRFESQENTFLKVKYISLYSSIVEVKINSQLLREVKKVIRNLEDRVKIEKTLTKKGRLDITDLLNTEGKLAQMIKEKNHLVRMIELHRNLIDNQIRKEVDHQNLIKHASLKTVKQIKQVIKSTNFTTKDHDLELEKSELEYQLLSEENNKLIDYVELNYEKTDKNLNNEEDYKVGIKVSINIPFGQDAIKSNEALIKRMKAKVDSRINLAQTVSEIDLLKSEIFENTDLYLSSKESKNLVEIKKHFKHYSQTKGSSPLKLLKLKQMILEHQVRELVLEKQIHLAFLKFLNLANTTVSDVKKAIKI